MGRSQKSAHKQVERLQSNEIAEAKQIEQESKELTHISAVLQSNEIAEVTQTGLESKVLAHISVVVAIE